MKTKNIFITLFFLSAFVLPSGGQSHFIKAKEDSLLSLLEQKNKAMGSLAVMDKGKIIYARAIGHAGITPEKKVSDEKTRYRIGSISKMFTATLVFQLIEENKLQLSATLDKFFPSVRNAEKITIGNLLNHRSGIHNFTNEDAYKTYMTKTKTKSEMIGIISANVPDFEPGDRYEYSNSNYVLLGYIVEDLRKESYENVLQKYICSRAGLSDTHYGGNTDLSKNESYSFRYVEGWIRQPETDMSIPHGAGAIVSTPSDLVKFITALFDGKLIKPESLIKMKTISDGMGMGIQQFPYEKKTVYGHAGGIDGFNSILIYIPEDKLAISYCSNGTVYAVNDILLRTLNNYYGQQEKLQEFKVYVVNPVELDKYLGVYSNPSVPLKLTISKNNDRLFGQGTGQSSFPLEGSAKDEFRFEAAGITIFFKPEKNELELKQGGKLTTFTREE